MLHRYRSGTVPRDPATHAPPPIETAARAAVAGYARAMDALALEQGAAQWMELAAHANRYIEETAPWKLAQRGQDAELDTVLANLARTAARLAVLAAPFIPRAAATVWGLFGERAPLETIRLDDLESLSAERLQVAKPPILFPKPEGTLRGAQKLVTELTSPSVDGFRRGAFVSAPTTEARPMTQPSSGLRVLVPYDAP